MSCENCCPYDDEPGECGCCQRIAKLEEALKKKRAYVYEVWRNTPCGDIVMGTYSTLKKAKRVEKTWNDSTSYFLDKASVHQRKVQ